MTPVSVPRRGGVTRAGRPTATPYPSPFAVPKSTPIPAHSTHGEPATAASSSPETASAAATASSRRDPARRCSGPRPSSTALNTTIAVPNTPAAPPADSPTSAAASCATRLQANSVPTDRFAAAPAVTSRAGVSGEVVHLLESVHRRRDPLVAGLELQREVEGVVPRLVQ